MGPETSAQRTALMDSVETVMKQRGYATLSARSVTQPLGLGYQIVYYYFETMDDLIVATYARHTKRIEQRVRRALKSAAPLRSFWTAYGDREHAMLNIEFMALANHNEAIRLLTVDHGKRMREIAMPSIVAMTRNAGLYGQPFDPAAMTVILGATASILGFEAALGLTAGHVEASSQIEAWLKVLEAGNVTSDESVPDIAS